MLLFLKRHTERKRGGMGKKGRKRGRKIERKKGHGEENNININTTILTIKNWLIHCVHGAKSW